MKIELQSLENGKGEFAFEIPADEVGLDHDVVRLLSPVKLNCRVLTDSERVTAEGEISAITEIDCSRCLEPVQTTHSIDFRSAFVTLERFEDAKEFEITGDDFSVDVFDGISIDPAEIVREQILLTLPEQTFCREDCKGLCPKCGENRNLVDCNCNDTEIDPRWAALKEMK